MIRIRSWAKWQGPAVYEIVRKRKKDARPMPVILGYVAVATNFDDKTGNFERFAALVGGGILARGYLTMVFGHMAREDASTDILRCGPDQFGHLVLSDRSISTPPRIGRKVYEALILSGIAEEVDPLKEARSGPPDTRPDAREDGPPSGPPSGPGRLEEMGLELPPSPLAGGESSPSAPPQSPQVHGEVAPDAEPRPLRPRDRERFAKVLDYVIRCGAGHEQYFAQEVRRRFRSSQVQDAEITEMLTGTFRWVTPERLARFLGNKPHDE